MTLLAIDQIDLDLHLRIYFYFTLTELIDILL